MSALLTLGCASRTAGEDAGPPPLGGDETSPAIPSPVTDSRDASTADASDADAGRFIFSERRASESLDKLAGRVAIRHEKRGAVITLSCDNIVEPGQWALNITGRFALNGIAAALRDQDGHAILIQGFTDSRGDALSNDALSLRRAEAVRDYLMTQGIGEERMKPEGLGARQPLADNATPEGRSRNRRIEIVIEP